MRNPDIFDPDLFHLRNPMKKAFTPFALLLPALATGAFDNAPPLKEGLWSIHMNNQGQTTIIF
jgi:hypothetical protein